MNENGCKKTAATMLNARLGERRTTCGCGNEQQSHESRGRATSENKEVVPTVWY
jgi:hypothetical protein